MNSKSADLSPTFAAFIDSKNLAPLGPGPRSSRRPLSDLNGDLQKAFSREHLGSESEQLVRALILLWHDYLDEAHTLCQDVSSTNGSFVHAIMHRREPDYWNSKYWFNRVGSHPSFPEVARQAATLIPEGSPLHKMLTGNRWNPGTFVDLCEQFAGEPASTEYQLLQQVQGVETRVLLHHLVGLVR